MPSPTDPCILDARTGAPQRWPEGSHRADLEHHLSSPHDAADGGRHPLPSPQAWRATLGRWGITPHTSVIVTDDQHGGLAAARCWWMLRAIGHARVEVQPIDTLERAWTQEATPLLEGPAYPGSGDWQWPVVDADVVERRRLDPSWRVIDARAAERFRGEVEPIDPVAGHIPGAHNLPWLDHLEPARFLDRFQAIRGDVPMERVIVHCGSGVTACHSLLQLDRLGLGQPSLYVGSWSEWCRQQRPVGTVSS